MKSKIINLLRIIILIIFIGITRVFAADNYTCNLSITGDKTSIKPGETITYEIKASNINAGTGIKKLETYIDYDENSFDCRVESDDAGKWSRTGFLEGYLTMDTSDLEPISDDQTIAKVIFTAKTGISDNTYQVIFSSISITTGDDSKFEIANKTVDIQVASSQGGENTPGENTPGENTPGENTPGENTPGENTPGESTPGESTPGESTPGESTPGENTPGENTPGENTPEGSTKDDDKKNIDSEIENVEKNDAEKLPYSGESVIFGKILIIGVLISLSAWLYTKYKYINV